MKKAITLGLAIAMLSSMATLVSAEGTTLVGNNSHTDFSVLAKYTPSRSTVYSVKLTWGSMQFNYGAKETWDATTHEWKLSAGTDRWTVAEENGNIITVENNSSVPMTASFAFTQDATNGTDITGSFSGKALVDNVVSLPAPEAGVDSTAYAVQFVPTGTISTNLTVDYEKIGTITVTVRDATPSNLS